MKLTKEELKKVIKGAHLIIDEEDGYVSFSHFSKAQLEYLTFSDFFRARAVFSSSVRIEFLSNAENLSLAYKILQYGSKDTIEVYCNGVETAMKKVEEMEQEGTVSFTLPKGEKDIVVYLPFDLQFAIKDLELDGNYKQKADKRENVLFIGDSITQGYGTFSTGSTYVNVLARILDWNVLNQGMGGYIYDSKILTPIDDYRPDKIVVALGVNGHNNPDRETWICEFYKRFNDLYADIPTLVITPLWVNPADIVESELVRTRELIEQYAGKCANVKIVDGLTLIPGEDKYFCDGLHPNALGARVYAERLAEKIREIEF